jgi:hypothetical protein
MLKQLAFAATIALGATGAAATTLTFDGNICNGGACANGAFIVQSYGDVAGQLDVVYRATVTLTAPSQVRLASTGYGDLTNAAIGSPFSTAEVFLQPVGGASIALLGLDLGSYASQSRNTVVTILAGDGTPLFSSGTLALGAGHAHLSFNLSDPSGIRIQWGNLDAGNVAIDNIEFSVTVPEPRVGALLVAGLSALAFAARRRVSH